MEEWISLNEYMRRYRMGYNEVKRLILKNDVEWRQTEGGHYKIKVGGDTVSREQYEYERERRIQAETTLELLQNLILERRRNKWKNQIRFMLLLEKQYVT